MSDRIHENDQQPDNDLSKIYDELAREDVPPELDRKILTMADSGQRPAVIRWGRPIAIAATVVICFSLLLNLAQGPDDSQFREPTSRGVADDGSRSTPARMLPASEERPGNAMRAAQDTAEQASPAAASAALAAESLAAGPVTDLEPVQEASSCETAAQAQPELWWQCIAALRAQGLEQEAEAEILLLRQVFPEFPLPK